MDLTRKAKELKERYKQSWLAMDGVVAVGVGLVDREQVGIIISAQKNIEKIRTLIPDHLEGIPIKVQESGEIKAW